jgi:hypothetical protein
MNEINEAYMNIVTYGAVHVTKMTGSSSDHWILIALSITTTLNYAYIDAPLLLDHIRYSPPLHAH